MYRAKLASYSYRKNGPSSNAQWMGCVCVFSVVGTVYAIAYSIIGATTHASTYPACTQHAYTHQTHIYFSMRMCARCGSCSSIDLPQGTRAYQYHYCVCAPAHAKGWTRRTRVTPARTQRVLARSRVSTREPRRALASRTVVECVSV